MKASLLAESATLGSLLLDERPMAQVARWLRPGDFADPWHTELYTVLRERSVARQETGAEAVGLALLDRLGHRRAELVRVQDVLRSVPVPAAPIHYARMVLEGSLRREITCQGVLLRACALAAALQRDARPVTVGTSMVRDTLGDGERRWQLASGGSPLAEVTHPELAPALRNLDRYLAADRLLTAHPPLDTEDVGAHERTLVCSLIVRPGALPAVRRWLRPQAFQDEAWRAAYLAVLELHDRHAPIDPVTVAWEIQRAAAQHGPGPDPAQLTKAGDIAGASEPTFHGKDVAAALVRRTADHAARSLEAAAMNPGLDLPSVYETGSLVLEGVLAASEGLQPHPDSAPGRHLAAVQDLGPGRPQADLVLPESG